MVGWVRVITKRQIGGSIPIAVEASSLRGERVVGSYVNLRRASRLGRPLADASSEERCTYNTPCGRNAVWGGGSTNTSVSCSISPNPLGSGYSTLFAALAA